MKIKSCKKLYAYGFSTHIPPAYFYPHTPSVFLPPCPQCTYFYPHTPSVFLPLTPSVIVHLLTHDGMSCKALNPQPFCSVLNTSVLTYSAFWNLLFEQKAPQGHRLPLKDNDTLLTVPPIPCYRLTHHSIINRRFRQSGPHAFEGSSTLASNAHSQIIFLAFFLSLLEYFSLR